MANMEQLEEKVDEMGLMVKDIHRTLTNNEYNNQNGIVSTVLRHDQELRDMKIYNEVKERSRSKRERVVIIVAAVFTALQTILAFCIAIWKVSNK